MILRYCCGFLLIQFCLLSLAAVWISGKIFNFSRENVKESSSRQEFKRNFLLHVIGTLALNYS